MLDQSDWFWHLCVMLFMNKEYQNLLQKDEYRDTAPHAASLRGSLDMLKYFLNRLYVKVRQTLISVTDELELYYSRGLLATSFVSGLQLEWGLP